MQLSRSARWLLLALVVTLIPLSSQAGVFISVNFGPPVLPVYVQPPCPQAGLMWTPGFWAYGPDGYYWVPGAWVPAPYPGALWTPGYWGWSNGMYIFHDGYWGRHVGYYGGVNYGYGYGGIGFAGGEWRGGHFFYNTAVMHVDGRYVHSTFMDRGRVDRGFVARDSHVAFSGGLGGIRYQPNAEERMAEHEQHMGRTSFQEQHMAAARSDRNSYARSNGGHPSHMVAERPLGGEGRGPAPAARPENRPEPRPEARPEPSPEVRPEPRPEVRPAPRPENRPEPRNEAKPASHSAPPAHTTHKDEPKQR